MKHSISYVYLLVPQSNLYSHELMKKKNLICDSCVAVYWGNYGIDQT